MDERERHRADELVMKARAGDRGTFSRLVERYSPDLTRFVRCLVGNPHDVRDVLQEVWIKAWDNLGGLCDVRAFRGWVRRIAVNEANRLMRGAIHPFESLDDVNGAIISDTDDSDFRKRHIALLGQGLGLLRDDHRRVLILHYVKNMRIEKIAGIMGCSPATVRSRLYHAKLKLRRWIRENRRE